MPPGFSQSGFLIQISTGYWTSSPDQGVEEAELPALPGPGNFSIPLSFAQTVQAFGNAGIAPSPLDNRLNLFHGTDFNLRDFSSVCSAHVLLNVNSGQSPGQPTTGSMHFDMFNPASNIPLYPFSPEGSQAMFISLHGLVDLAPWLVSLGTGVSLPSAGSLCQ